MKPTHLILVALFSLAFSSNAAHPFLCCDYQGNKVAAVSADGKIEWEFSCPNPQDCWLLPNKNYLICYRTGARELTPDKQTVWEYKAPEKVEVHSCQPLPNANVLVAEGGTCRIIEIDRAGKIVKELRIPAAAQSTHEQVRGVRKAKNGHYFLSLKGEHKVAELGSDGKTIREIKIPGDTHEVVPLANGHLLITCGDGHKVIELDGAEKVVWELNENDLPNNPLRLAAGCQRLPNGNTIVCNYLGHGFVGKQSQFLEVSRDKKIVWEFHDDQQFKTINQVQLLDVPGDVTKGEIAR
jgi:hypothetical protein